MTMNIGPFPLISMAGWLVFLPSGFWDWIEKRAGALFPQISRGATKALHPTIRSEKKYWWYAIRWTWLGQLGAGSAVAYMIVWNLGTLWPTMQLPPSYKTIGWALRLDQAWTMFAPYPTKRDAWTVAVGRLSDGRSVDLMRGGKPVDWTRPVDYREVYPNYRWRKHGSNLWQDYNARHAKLFAEFLMRQWGWEHAGEPRVEKVEVFCVYQITLPNNRSTPVRINRLATASRTTASER